MKTFFPRSSKKKIQVNFAKWWKIGFSTTPGDPKTAREGLRLIYGAAGLDVPREIIWSKSPFGCLEAMEAISRNDPSRLGDPVDFLDCMAIRTQFERKIVKDLQARITAGVRAGLKDAGSGSLPLALRRDIADEVCGRIGGSIWNEIFPECMEKAVREIKRDLTGSDDRGLANRLWADLKRHFKKSDINQLRSHIDTGQIWHLGNIWDAVCEGLENRGEGWFNLFQREAAFFAIYEYYFKKCGFEDPAFRGAVKLAESCCGALAFTKVCFISDRPDVIRLVVTRLHCDGGPALRFRDGWSSYALNGVDVPRELAEPPPDNVDCKLLFRLQNAEVRRELIRKVGIERVCKELNAQTIDCEGGYELLGLDFHDGRRRPYLKMLNPSIGTYHIEGVPPEIQTVQQALAWRNGTGERPEILT